MIGNRPSLAIAFALIVVAAIVLPVGVVVAGDASIAFGTDPRVAEAVPGDEVTMVLTIRTDGDYVGNGLVEYEYTLVYNPHVLTLVDIEDGDYLEESGLDVERERDHDPGELTIHNEIDPLDDGVTGDGVIGTVTFEIAEDAPPSDIVIGYEHTDGMFTADSPPFATFAHNGTIEVDGGGDEIAPTDQLNGADDNGDTNGDGDDTNGADDSVTNGDDKGADDSDDGVGVIRADDTDRNGQTNDDDNTDQDPPGDDDDGEESLPGFGAAAIIGLAVAGWLATRHRSNP